VEEKLDRWLETALAEYADVHPPLGFEARTMARLREDKPRRGWIWELGFAVAAAAVFVMVIRVTVNRAIPADPPVITARIVVPQIQRVVVETSAPPARRVVERQDATRGVPIVASPVTPQEEAILRLVGNSRAQQLASLAVRHGDLTKESNQLQIQELNIPPVVKEEEQ